VTKVSQLLKVIEGAHVLGTDGLRDYHTAKRVINSNRIALAGKRFATIRAELKNHHVIVSLNDDYTIRVYRPDTQSEMVLR
jgi:hypothetical protein